MAVNGIDILNAAKRQKEQYENPQPQQKTQIKEKLSSSIDEITNQYFGDDSVGDNLDFTVYPNGEKRPIYNPHEEMKAIQNGENFNMKESKMPSAILESIMRNPLPMPTEGMNLEESVMNTELQSKTLDIINKLESNDKKNKSYVSNNRQNDVNTVNESTGLYTSSVEPDNLAQMIESIMDKKLKQYAGAIINESRKNTEKSTGLKFMRLGETFTFMDDANNVYECKMVYKGKGKVKTK